MLTPELFILLSGETNWSKLVKLSLMLNCKGSRPNPAVKSVPLWLAPPRFPPCELYLGDTGCFCGLREMGTGDI